MLVVLLTFTLAFFAGCQQQRAEQPTVEESVQRSLEQAGLQDIKVSEDRENRVVTLEGEVQSEAQKQQAEEAARQAASGWMIANQVLVAAEGAEDHKEEVASAEDDAIKSHIDAEFKKAKFDEFDVKYSVENGVVTLEGEVENAQLRQQAEKIAAGAPNVKQVVNKIDVKAGTRP
jgi:osmotically-inducible protein OsmY